MEAVEERIGQELRRRGKSLALAESCTGGEVAARLTAVAGASDYFLGSVVAYANEWKERFLGVKSLAKGAVSREVVVEMVEGVLAMGADFALAVSGIAGPTGGTREKPVGTVYIGIGEKGKSEVVLHHFSGDRASIVRQTVEEALSMLLRRLQ